MNMAEKKENKPTVELAQAKVSAGEKLTAEENTLLRKHELERAHSITAER